MAVQFYLSYAQADEDGYVARFYEDLAREVRRQGGPVDDEIGFRDVASLRLGSMWSHDLISALSTARTFVALCSPSYFASEFCGREWAAFVVRAENYRRQHGVHPPTLLPVIWVPVNRMPDPVQELQHHHGEIGSAYRREGLYHLLRLRRYRDDYHDLLRDLALRIVDVAARHPMQPLPASFDVLDTPSVFHSPGLAALRSGTTANSGPRPATEQPALPAARLSRGGPQHVHFVVVAAASRDLVDVRNDLQHYGPEPFDWAPYRPEFEQRICVFAQQVAASQDLTSGLAEADLVLELLERAISRNELVVLLVDVWTATLDSYRQHLIAYDLRNEPSSAVMVPWSSHDRETVANAAALRHCPKHVGDWAVYGGVWAGVVTSW